MIDPIPLMIEWLNTATPLAGMPITSTLDVHSTLPAVVVASAIGAPRTIAHGIDTAGEWTVTIYCVAGRTGAGLAYPDTAGAAAVQGHIVDLFRTLNGGGRWTSSAGVTIASAAIVTQSRSIDQAGNARATMTVTVRAFQ